MAIASEGRITDEALAEMEKRKGVKLRVHINNYSATRENIRNFVYGVGDGNPLWLDEEYCKKTRYGRIAAPPSWLYSVHGPGVQHGLPGVMGYHSGDDWEFYKPILLGDEIRPEAMYAGYKDMPSRLAGRAIIQYLDKKYYNQRGELVAKGQMHTHRVERQATRGKNKFKDIQVPHPWKDEEIEKIEADILAEEIRGSKVRYWEDVAEGDDVGPLIKGPLGMTDNISFQAGAHLNILPANEVALRLYKRHPAWGIRDPETHSWEPIVSNHWNVRSARNAGMPSAYDVGMQRQSWLIQFFTNWMGDEGWLKSCFAEYRAFVFLSDVVWFRGKVTRKFVDGEGECCVEIETDAFNQRKENTTIGKGIVALPSIDKKTWPVQKRLSK